MDLIKSIIMGIVQGVCEFLPISSDGHLALMKYILHMNTDHGILFDVLLHFGTLLAVFIAFWDDILILIIQGIGIILDVLVNFIHLIRNLIFRQKLPFRKLISNPNRKLVVLILAATVPTALIGVIFDNAIEVAGRSLLVPGLGLILTGILLNIADRLKAGEKREMQASYQEAGLIGIAQGLAILPGLSRSGSTITACLISGYERSFAVKYSFLMSIPAVLGAVVFKVRDVSWTEISQNELLNYLVGTIVAAFVGFLAIKAMLHIVRNNKFRIFATYCIIIGSFAVISYIVN